MANLGAGLTTSQYLTSADYLTSANGLFFAIVQGDGNFCVYYGTGPNDNKGLLWSAGQTGSGSEFFGILQPEGNFAVYAGTGPTDNQGYVWETSGPQAQGSYFAILQTDGNFCVYRGTGANDNEGKVWCSGATDSIETVDPIDSIVYDVDNATIESSQFMELYSQDVPNGTIETQTTTVTSAADVTTSSGWSDSLGINVGVSTTFKASIPFVESGKVTVSASVTNTYTWNGSYSTTKSMSLSTPVTVPPGCEIKVTFSITISTISVPYVLTGMANLQSGKSMPITVNGTYAGTTSYDLVTSYTSDDPGCTASATSTT